MFAFGVPRDVTLSSRYGHRTIRASLPKDAAGGLDPAQIILAVHDEDVLAREALDAGKGAEESLALRRYGEAELMGWPGWPQRLGRATVDRHKGLVVIDAPAPLPGQLAALRERHPRKRHFRIALVGGFGFNLGDTLLGATAWRAVLPALRATLPSLSADVLLGPAAHPAIPGLLGFEDGIGQVFCQSPSLQDFARYDAFFSFTQLIRLPRFHEMAAVDWLIWWCGLDPAAVPAEAKRNRLRLPTAAWQWAGARLAERSGPRIAFVWRASTPLRSMPDDLAVRFARTLLDAAPTITLVTERPLALSHPRLLDLGAETDSAERMMALVAQADGLIGVDSLAPHVADAAGVPAVMLLATLPKSRFPYYPLTRSLVPPGMDTLPGWGVTKVSDEAWAGMREGYGRAWRNVSAWACWRLLEARMAARTKAGGPCDAPAVELGPAREPGWTRMPDAGAPFPYDVTGVLGRWTDAEMARFAAQLLRPGHTVVLASGDSEGLAPALARLVAPGGALHVLEPRRLRAQKLVADIRAAGVATLHIWPAVAGPGTGRRDIPEFDPASEADPAAWGNVYRLIRVPVLRLDDLELPECHLLALRPPQDVRAALAGAEAILRDRRPLVMAGPVPAAALDALKQCLAPFGYGCWLCWPNRTHFAAAFVLATPAGSAHSFDGFEAL